MQLRSFDITPKIEESVTELMQSIETEKEPVNIHKNHRARLKSQYKNNGFATLTDIQKLELLLFFAIPQKDTNPIAHNLINHFGSLQEVLSASAKELETISGVKENTSLLISLINDFSRFFNTPSTDFIISSSSKAKEYCTKLFHKAEVEQFYVICLTSSNKVKKTVMIKSGNIDEVNVQIRNITSVALDSKCSRIIIAHNHPAGNGRMSDEDCRFTYGLLCSCLLNSIEILDHIIVGIDKTISISEQHILQKLKEHAVKTIQISPDKLNTIAEGSKPYVIDEEN